MKLRGRWVMGVVGLLAACGTSASPGPSVSVGAFTYPSGGVYSAPSDTSVAQPVDTVPVGPPAALSSDGTFAVPGDIAPGTYTAEAPSASCYWSRLKGTSGSVDGILANENAVGPTIVTILKTDKAFTTNGCGDWTTGLPAFVSDPTQINDGTYAVGPNVTPGTYKTTGQAGCYWARLADFTGGISSILANDNTDGQAIVTILRTDKGFTSHGCGTWIKN